jgi:pyruvate,water dikinase
MEMAQRPDQIVWLGQGNCGDCMLVGGKGAILCHLAVDHRVPPAFCLTTVAFERWSGQDQGETAVFPPELYPLLVAAYDHLATLCGVEHPQVAVRSSAMDEDGCRASFAGQHATYLNVVGVEAVAQAVLRCWQSAYSTHALDYRRHWGLTEEVTMAVLIQQLIPADVSAVVFSANPVTGNREESFINASWGLGESIVGGRVTPDTYVVCKADLAIQQRQVADKERMTVPAANGVREISVPRWLRRQPVLTGDQIVEIARLSIRLEATMGWPVDVECAYRRGELYLLQCRPITAGMSRI